MVLIVHGFPNDVSGLRFEWAWQNPNKSRRLRDVPSKSSKESAFQFRWRVACNMLRTAPWKGLGLTVRWLKQEYQQEFPIGLEPPLHMPVVFGPVVSKKVAGSKKQKKSNSDDPVVTESVSQSCPEKTNSQDWPERRLCAICYFRIQKEDKTLSCLHPACIMIAHITCLARSFLDDPSKLLPVEGRCPRCDVNLLWGELVRQEKGCYKNLSKSALEEDTGSAEGAEGQPTSTTESEETS